MELYKNSNGLFVIWKKTESLEKWIGVLEDSINSYGNNIKSFALSTSSWIKH